MVWAPTSLEQSIEGCEYHPSFFLDHQYLRVKFSLVERITTGPGVWKFNSSLPEDKGYCELVTSFWSFLKSLSPSDVFGSPMDWWDQEKFYLREVTRSYCRAQATVRRDQKASLTRQMHHLQQLFEQGDASAFAELSKVQEDLRGIALHEAKGAQVCVRCQWAEEGETSSSFFLNLASKRHAKQVMHSIRNPETGIISQ